MPKRQIFCSEPCFLLSNVIITSALYLIGPELGHFLTWMPSVFFCSFSYSFQSSAWILPLYQPSPFLHVLPSLSFAVVLWMLCALSGWESYLKCTKIKDCIFILVMLVCSINIIFFRKDLSVLCISQCTYWYLLYVCF